MDKNNTSERMQSLLDFIKRKKIPYSYLVESTGYSRPHISSVLNELKPCTPQFFRLISLALKKFIDEDESHLKKAKEELWKPPEDPHTMR